jgi:undecaprenyl-diphosphatase
VNSRLRALAATVALGTLSVLFVFERDAPRLDARIMSTEHAWVGHGTLLAWWLTNLCYPYVLVPFCLVLIALAMRFPRWRSRVAFAIVALLVAWRGADLLQRLFARPRRLDWIVKHETSYSYPSSHAAITTAFYLLLALFVAESTLRGRVWYAAALVLLALGIMWSRLALGAHYVSDIAGGVLFGCAVVAGLAACWPTNVFEGRRLPSLE